MFYVVPKDCTVVKYIGTFQSLEPAKQFADDMKKERGVNFDIIQMERVWTTQTFVEAHILSLDIPHIAQD